MSTHLTPAEQALREAALEYHRAPVRGKIAVTPLKPLMNQRDLSLAYSPGVAYACLDIVDDPSKAAEYTSRGNLVGVVTNGTAVLGLGDIGPLAGKPVMEGKGCLFKKFAGIDVFDIELAERDPDKLVEIIAALEPTLGGVNLEDIKAPECFYIEKKLRERMKIPVFHDDQHGTAIISGAALLNGLELVGKPIGEVKLAVSGAGAAAIACLDLMVGLGVKIENIYVCDSKGVIQSERADAVAGKLDESKQRYCQKTAARTLADAVQGADVFLGCSAAGVLSADMVRTMASQPIILALANPEPEIRPELAKEARPDCIIATGRSDYPNQVNNVLCFPYIFRGALDCGATKITEAMKLACVREIAALAKEETSDEVAAAYAGQELQFGPDPQALRCAIDPAHCPGGGQGGRGIRRGRAADRRPGRLPRVADPLRLPDRHVHAPGLCRGQAPPGAGGLRRGRGRARAARGAGHAGRGHGQAAAGGPTLGDRDAHRARRPETQAGRGLRGHQPGRRPPLSRLLGALPPPDGA
jgi:malate dehydrogenase (oxaloacetate-decarboxylating)(NADP+)